MKRYCFEADELSSLLVDTINLYREYVEQHGHPMAMAVIDTVLETLEGLDAEHELYLRGELKHTHVEEYDAEMGKVE